MKLIEYINPLRIADQLGSYYLPTLFGAWFLIMIIGATCVGK